MCVPFVSLRNVLILLPPSEGKSAALAGAGRGPVRPVVPRRCAPARKAVLAALVACAVATSTWPPRRSGLGPDAARARSAPTPCCAPSPALPRSRSTRASCTRRSTTPGSRLPAGAARTSRWRSRRPSGDSYGRSDLIPAYRLSAGTIPARPRPDRPDVAGPGVVRHRLRRRPHRRPAIQRLRRPRSGARSRRGPDGDRARPAGAQRPADGRQPLQQGDEGTHRPGACCRRAARPRTPAAFAEALDALGFRVETQPARTGAADRRSTSSSTSRDGRQVPCGAGTSRRCAASAKLNIDALPSGNHASVLSEHGGSSMR